MTNSPIQNTIFSMSLVRAAVLWLSCALALSAGPRYVSPVNTYFRVYAVVPMTGSGTPADPVRPLYAPTAGEIGRTSGILGFTSELSDDGKYALIEIVAHDRAAVAKMLADSSIQTFIKGAPATPASVQSVFQQHKASFNFATFDELPVR